MGTDDGSSRRGRRSKVGRVIDEYDLDGVGDELERYWTAADGGERKSLRELAAYFNRRVLERALSDAGVAVIEGEVENTYRLLTGDDVSSADRTRVERELAREGVDVEELQSDFVSYQAIRTYLRDRGAERDASETDPREKALTTVQRLRSRLTTVATERLERLRSSGEVTLGEFRVLLTLRVVCEDCETQIEYGDLLREGGCDCGE